MEIRPILSALTHHKTGTLLVVLQIAVSLAIIVNAAFIVHARMAKIDRPTGFDNHQLIAARVRGVGADYDASANIRRDLDMLRHLPGVRYATVMNQVPLSSSGSSTGIRTVADDNVTPVTTAIWDVDATGLDTLGVNIVRGRNFYPEEIRTSIPGKTPPYHAKVAIVTRALAKKLFPDSDALGKTFYWNGAKPCTIIGIVDHMQGAWPHWEGLNRNVFRPHVTASKNSTYLIRTEPGQRDKLIPVIEQQLTKVNPHRVVRYVKSEDDIIKRTYEMDFTMAHILSVFIILLVGLTSLVLVGLASWFVTQRIKQIGTRRALGATGADIQRYFLVENWLITTGGAIVGSLLTVTLSYWLETSFDLPRLDWRYLAVSVILLWIVSLASAWWPARRASRVSPAVATRTI